MVSPYQEGAGCGYNPTPPSAAGREHYFETYHGNELMMSNAFDDSQLFAKVCEIRDLLAAGIGPGPGGGRVLMFSAIRRGTVNALGIDLRREDRSATSITPFIVPLGIELDVITMRVTASTADWDLDVLASTDGGTVYNSIYSKSYTAGTTFDRVTGLATSVTVDTLLRFRYTRTSVSGSISNLQVNLLANIT